MVKNIRHPVDKALRIVLGVALLALIFLIEGSARWWGLVGILPILTVLAGWCPAYAALDACGCKEKHP